jgi:hypothetical protein
VHDVEQDGHLKDAEQQRAEGVANKGLDQRFVVMSGANPKTAA